jgi:hypothetical protein
MRNQLATLASRHIATQEASSPQSLHQINKNGVPNSSAEFLRVSNSVVIFLYGYGSVPLSYGSGFGFEPDQEPALFVSGFQDFDKK